MGSFDRHVGLAQTQFNDWVGAAAMDAEAVELEAALGLPEGVELIALKVWWARERGSITVFAAREGDVPTSADLAAGRRRVVRVHEYSRDDLGIDSLLALVQQFDIVIVKSLKYAVEDPTIKLPYRLSVQGAFDWDGVQWAPRE